MAYISFQPKDFFNTVLWTGTGGSGGSGKTITGVGFQPDFTWIKSRSDTFDHILQNSVRGATYQLNTNNSAVESNRTDELTAWNSDGFVLGIDTVEGVVNNGGATYVGWNWKAGTTSGIATNGSTTITPSAYSFNQTSGISVIKYSGNSTGGAKVAHGLGTAPAMIMVKNLGGTDSWQIYHKHTAAKPEDYLLQINTTGAAVDNNDFWYDQAPDDVNFTVGSDNGVNGSYDYVAYCFAEKTGYSKCGTFKGNNSSTDGTFVYTGFRPAFVLVKVTDYSAAWTLFDSSRLGYNLQNKVFTPNTGGAEYAAHWSDIYANGFKPFNNDPQINSNQTYVYLAFSEFPIVSSNGIPALAR